MTQDGGQGDLAAELSGITKRFGDLIANDVVDFSVQRGEVHALLGENGAGKTTLMRVLYGLTRPDGGMIRVDDRPVEIHSPSDAIEAGVGMVTQHFSLVQPMTVTENIILGRAQGARLDLASAHEAVEAAAGRFGIAIQPDAVVSDLSVGEQQRVEIIKALARDCRLLILDEPTAVLVPQEVDALFETLRRLAADGLSVVFISHKLGEVRAISQRVSVMRQGRMVGTVSGETGERELARMMVGRPTFGVERQDPPQRGGEARLQVRGVSATGVHDLPALTDVDLDIHAGEILGVAGVSGNGQTELAEVLSGMRPATAGRATVDGTEITNVDPGAVMAAGVGRIPEDRHASLVLDLSVALNLIMEHIDDFSGRGGLDGARVDTHARELIERYHIKARPGDRVATLSGGNIQKVLLARVLARDPHVVIVSQPTRGVDVGASEYVRNELLARRRDGAAILLMSEDLDELISLSDRLVVLYEGRIVGRLDAADADAEELGMLMAGRGQRAA
jgi:simple sugar transport system ATP-binding protein